MNYSKAATPPPTPDSPVIPRRREESKAQAHHSPTSSPPTPTPSVQPPRAGCKCAYGVNPSRWAGRSYPLSLDGSKMRLRRKGARVRVIPSPALGPLTLSDESKG